VEYPNFSVVIPAYNYGHVLHHAVESALQQPGDDFEILIIDDGSQDRTPEVGQGLADRFPGKVRYLRQENKGPAAVRNLGVRESSGRFLMFLDADDRLLPGALDGFRKYLEEEGDCDLVFGGHVSLHSDGRRRLHPAKRLSASREKNFVGYLRRKFGISNGATIMSRDIFDKIRYPEEIRNSEDIPVFAQALALFRCGSFPEPVLELHKHGDSLRNKVDLIINTGTRIVDLLFDPAVLPAPFMANEGEMRGRQCLSVFRSLYLAGRYGEARQWFRQGLRCRWLLLFEWSYLRKYLKCLGRE
jgi:glycosyltransferase involved in cell wall biosynthesis